MAAKIQMPFAAGPKGKWSAPASEVVVIAVAGGLAAAAIGFLVFL